MKIGVNSNKQKKYQIDLSFGVGRVFSTKSLLVSEYDLLDNKLQPLTDTELMEKFNKPKGFEATWAPHAQLRGFYKFGNKKVNPASPSHTK